MNIFKNYRLLMVFIVALLILAGGIMAFGESLVPHPENSMGKIMISRRCVL